MLISSVTGIGGGGADLSGASSQLQSQPANTLRSSDAVPTIASTMVLAPSTPAVNVALNISVPGSVAFDSDSQAVVAVAGADTYQKPQLVSETFSSVRSAADGESVRAMKEHLEASVGRFNNGMALKASGFLSQLSALSATTPDFEGQQRITQLSEEAAAAGVGPDFSERLRDVESGMVLEVRTREGDLVTVELEAARGSNGEPGILFSMSVEGELSETEQVALDGLANQLGGLSDQFFEKGAAALSELEGLNTGVLNGFSLELTDKTHGELKLEHEVSSATGVQSFKGEYQGYSFDIETALGQLVTGDNLTDNAQYQQYLSLIDQSAYEYGADNDVSRFLKDGMNVLFGVVPQEAEKEGISARQGAQLDKFFSNLPDFSAQFESSKQVNPYNSSDTAYMSLGMNQQTELSRTDTGQLDAVQRFSYEQTVKTFEALPGQEHPDLKGGNYIMQTLKRDESVTRMLRFAGEQPEAALEARQGRELLSREYKERFMVVDSDQDERSHSSVSNLMKEAKELGTEHYQNRLDDLMDSENLKLFELAGLFRGEQVGRAAV
ncbi:MAG: hypothetical protein OIF57_15980 [Marinobacterium sp.]|nr:hypothetical protein [Marinobacterium sp.]